MDRRGFICAGCWTVDRIKKIDLWPAEETLARIIAVDRQGGGSAHNVGIDLRKLDPDMPVATVGLLGHDEDGDFLFQRATRYQLDTSQLHRCGDRETSYTDVMTVADTGKRTFFHNTGSNDLLTPGHFDFIDRPERILHLGLLSLHALLDAENDRHGNGWADILAEAQANGLKTSIEMVSIDPVLNRKLATPCLPHIDYLVLNDQEIGSLAGLPTVTDGVTDPAACLQAAEMVLTNGRMELVAVHYPGGAVCVTRDGDRQIVPSLSVPQSLVQGSVGAGDAFVAGFLYGIHEQWPVADALELAHVVAAASLRSVTTTGSVESIEQCRQFAKQLSGS